jgi:hypothetical protein
MPTVWPGFTSSDTPASAGRSSRPGNAKWSSRTVTAPSMRSSGNASARSRIDGTTSRISPSRASPASPRCTMLITQPTMNVGNVSWIVYR